MADRKQEERCNAVRKPPPVPPEHVATSTSPSSQSCVTSIETADHASALTSSTARKPQLSAQTLLPLLPSPPNSDGGDPSQQVGKGTMSRLKRSRVVGEETAKSGGRPRVRHACEPCRQRKTKCSGARPVCQNCQDSKIACFYEDGKRDRVKKQIDTLQMKVADYEKLLKDLKSRVSKDDAQLIRISLEEDMGQDANETFNDGAVEAQFIPIARNQGGEREPRAETIASAGAGSTGALDGTVEDFTSERARSTGYIGTSSEIAWLQRLLRENKYRDIRSGPQAGDTEVPISEIDEGFTINQLNYHMDDVLIPTYEAVDLHELPTPEMASHLFDAYMDRVQPSFPIVGRLNFTRQFRRFIGGSTVQRPPNKWLALLNLIFAIGAKYSHLVNARWKDGEGDHHFYFSRARILAINSETILEHPDLQTIQIMGLMSFYLLTNDQINRSWLLLGIAIREACGLGLNMRNDSTKLKNDLKEIRYRLWWALYCLEGQLCNMTGRTSCILDEYCTTPLPVPLEEVNFETEEGQRLLSMEKQQGDRAPSSNLQISSPLSSTPFTDRSDYQIKIDSRGPSMSGISGDLEWAENAQPGPSLYFLYQIQLSRLTQRTFHMLYNPASLEGTWSDVQTKIKQLDEQLEHWYRKLPQAFAFRRKQHERSSYDVRLSLGFFFYSTKMTIHRPCLCRPDRKTPNQSTKSLECNRDSATACVRAAMEMLQLIPDRPNTAGLFRVGPWWNMLHWLVQAATVLMLEISFRIFHMPKEAEAILEACKKAIRWLHALAEDNPSAERAWTLCHTMLGEAAQKMGQEVNDLPQNILRRPSHPSDVSRAKFPKMENPVTETGLPLENSMDFVGMYYAQQFLFSDTCWF